MSIIPSGATKAAGRKDAEFGLNFVQVPDLELEFIHVSSSHSTLEHIAHGSHFDGEITTLTIRMKRTQRQSPVISSLIIWACETVSLQAPWVVKVGLLLSLQQRGEGGWRGGCKDHFYKLQHSFIITNFLNHTKISSIKWAAAKQTGRCTFRSVGWADPLYLQKNWHRVNSRSSKSFLVFRLHISNFNKILHLTECDVCRLTPHWSSSRPALVTDNGDSGQQNIQTPPSIFRSCFSTQLCLPCQHPTVVLMLHTTTEFIWRLRCLYRAINMKMIATQEWNMEHKLAIMLIV